MIKRQRIFQFSVDTQTRFGLIGNPLQLGRRQDDERGTEKGGKQKALPATRILECVSLSRKISYSVGLDTYKLPARSEHRSHILDC